MNEKFLQKRPSGLVEARKVGGFHLETPLPTPGTENLVFLAHTTGGASVVVKISISPDEETKQVRKREVLIQNDAARLTPNVASVVDHGEEHLVYATKKGLVEGDFSYSVTLFHRAGTMTDWIPSLHDPNANSKRKMLMLGELRDVTEAASAFGQASSTPKGGIVHRDIKPDNVLIKNGHAFLTDFREAIYTSEEENNEDGQVRATASLVSPEQVRTFRNYNHSTDSWYITELLLKILDGENLTHATIEDFQPAHEALFSPDSLKDHLRMRLQKIPYGFREIVEAGLSYYPKDRPAFQELFPALERAIENPDAPSIIYRAGKYR